VAFCPPVFAGNGSDPLDLVEPARIQALGGAAAAVDRDPTGVWLNPAAPSGSGRTVTLGGQRGFIEDQTWQISGAAPAGPVTAAAGVAYYDSGSIILRNTDGTARRVSGQRDILALLNASSALGAVSVGGSVKVLRSDLLDQFHATTVAADAGFVVRPAGDLAAGVSVVNVGRRVRYADERVPLPAALRAGGSAGTPIEGDGGLSPDRLAGFVDAVWLFRERRVEWRGGVEAYWTDSLAARAGVSPSRGNESWRAALGVGVFIGKLRIDYAVQLSGPSSLPQVLSLTVKV
jgi:hypothetical protein